MKLRIPVRGQDMANVEMVNVPPPPVDQVTVPVGLVWLPTSVSETVAVQVVVSPAFSVDAVQATLTSALRLIMVSVPVTTLEFGSLLGLKLAPPL